MLCRRRSFAGPPLAWDAPTLSLCNPTIFPLWTSGRGGKWHLSDFTQYYDYDYAVNVVEQCGFDTVGCTLDSYFVVLVGTNKAPSKDELIGSFLLTKCTYIFSLVRPILKLQYIEFFLMLESQQ